MDAKELMIGDWVLKKNVAKPEQIISIMKDEEVGYAHFDLIKTNHSCITCELSLYDPIPLTPEIITENNLILGKNVLEHNVGPFKEDSIIDINRHIIMIDDYEPKEFWCLHLCNKECNCFEGGSISMNLNLLYVHQFQQALRVVGLNELADNFKIQS